MSLLVWLPLDGDLHNQGLNGDISVTATGATSVSGGKIGKCYQFNGSAQYLQLSESLSDLYTGDFSWAVWLKPTDATRGVIFSEYASTGASNITFELLANRNIRVYWNASPDWSTGVTLTQDVWSHIAITRHENILKVYVNGKLRATKDNATLADRTSSAHIRIGDDYRGGTSVSYAGYMNDVRIYDHALSAKEVYDIAQGLILHYPLDNNFETNLIKNGYGELGNENWGGSVVVDSSDLPDDSKIKASFKNSTTAQYIPIDNMYSYKFQVWLKSSSTSGTTYPSFYPYDIDKKFIGHHHTKSGFNLNTMTKLKYDLNPGDDKIYVEDLSKWNANSGHYYNNAAIFGYADSTGYVYPDGVYTQNTLAFGSSTSAKTNLDKTNNIITLNNVYNGQTVLAGTSICASTNGGTYFYPFGGISKASLADWTFKTTTFSGNNDRLIAAKYLRYSTYDSVTANAGIKLINSTTLNEDIIYDASGYGHHGDIIGEIESINSSPRYTAAAYINSTDPTTNTTNGEFYISGDLALTTPNQISIAWWAYPQSGYGGTINHAMWSTTLNGIASDYTVSAFNHRDSGFDVNSSDGTHLRLSTSSFARNEWHHYVVTYDGKTAKLYKDGEEKSTVAFTENKTLGSFTKILIGHSHAGSVHRKMLGKYSDFRIYCTALSAEDVLALYKTTASVDRDGNIYTYVYQEE